MAPAGIEMRVSGAVLGLFLVGLPLLSRSRFVIHPVFVVSVAFIALTVLIVLLVATGTV